MASDLTRGHPPGEAMRACLLATELARRAGLDGPRQGEVYYATLMRFAGCAATSHEIAAAFGGDDIVVRARGDLIDPTQPPEALQFLAGLGVDAGRLRILGGPAGVARFKAEGARADCEVGADLTARLRLPEAVRRAVLDSFERFDGCGVPAGRAGPEIAEASRFAAALPRPAVSASRSEKEQKMSAEQNIRATKEMYEAFGRGDVEAILERVTDDVDWSTDAAIESAPWYGPRHGKEGVRGFFEAIGKTGPVTEFTPLSFASNDDGDVMVLIRYAFTVTGTGKNVAMNMHHYFTFRDGKVCFVRSSEDTAQVGAALTP